MGSAVSVPDVSAEKAHALSEAQIAYYGGWPDASIQLVLEALAADDVATGGGGRVNRLTWFEAFQDPTVIRPDTNTFLSLPLEEFALLEKAEAADGPIHTVSVVGPLALIGALAHDDDPDAPPREKLATLFKCLSFVPEEGGGAATNRTVALRLSDVLFRIGFLGARATDEHVAQLARELGRRHERSTDERDAADEAAFVAWALEQSAGRTGVLGRLKRLSGGAQQDRPAPPGAPHPTHKHFSASRRRAKPHRTHLEAHRRAHAKYGLEGDDAWAKWHSEGGEGPTPPSPTSAAAAHYHAALTRRESGRVSAVASSTVICQLLGETAFGAAELIKLKAFFLEHTDRVIAGVDGGLGETNKGFGKDAGALRVVSVEHLRTLLVELFPAMAKGRLLARVCAVFDANGTGSIDFVCFARGMSRLLHGFDEKIELLFQSWDSDGDGLLELWELSDTIADQQDDFREVLGYAASLCEALDADADGRFDRALLEAALLRHACVLGCAWLWMPPIFAKVEKLLTELQALAGPEKYTLEAVLRMRPKLMEACGGLGARDLSGSTDGRKILLDEFAAVVLAEWGLPLSGGGQKADALADAEPTASPTAAATTGGGAPPLASEFDASSARRFEGDVATDAHAIARGEALVRELHYEFSGEGNGVMYHGMELAGGGEPRDAAFEHSHELMTLLPLEAPVRPLWSALAMHAARATARAGSDAGAEASLVDRARIIAALCAWFEPDTHGESTPMVSNADIDLFFRMCQCKLTHIADNLADEVTRFDADFDGAISIDELKAHAAQNKERYLMLLGC